MNKYLSYSVKAQSVRRNNLTVLKCSNKVPYGTKEDASIKGQDCYLCPNCGRWHRTNQTNKLIRKLKGVK